MVIHFKHIQAVFSNSGVQNYVFVMKGAGLFVFIFGMSHEHF